MTTFYKLFRRYFKEYLLFMILFFVATEGIAVAIMFMTDKNFIKVLAIILGILVFAANIIVVLASKKIFEPLERFDKKFKEIRKLSGVNEDEEITELQTVFEQIETVLAYQEKVMEEKNARDLLEQKMKYAELQNQINPHFLYNTLENIRAQAYIDDNDTIAEMTEALSRFFRYNISKDNEVVTLAQELENIETYIQIQQYRFQNRFTFHIYYHENENLAVHCRMPKMTLQPVVENAIRHGVENNVIFMFISELAERKFFCWLKIMELEWMSIPLQISKKSFGVKNRMKTNMKNKKMEMELQCQISIVDFNFCMEMNME